MNKLKSIFTLKRVIVFFLSIFFILFLGGGCSFKYINPQYYRFVKLCKDVDKKVVVYNKYYFDIIKSIKDIKTDDRGCFYNEELKQEICFGYFSSSHNSVVFKYNKFGLRKTIQKRHYKNIHYLDYIVYTYTYYGLFLRGDEGVGFYWDTENTMECSIYGQL